MSEILEILKSEQTRVAKKLPELEPGTEEYSRAMDQFSILKWRVEELEDFAKENPATAFTTEEPVHTPEPEPAPTPVEEPKEEPAAETRVDDNVDWEKYRLALRERLGEARVNGVNTTELIAAMGAGKYSAVPDEKLPELSDLLDKALKEKK